MIDLKLTNGDLDLFSGDGLVHDTDEIIQTLQSELSSIRGEWFLDVGYGLNRSVVLGKVDIDDACNEIIRVIGNEPRVRLESDVSVEVDNTTREASFYFTVSKVDDGELLDLEVSGSGIKVRGI